MPGSLWVCVSGSAAFPDPKHLAAARLCSRGCSVRLQQSLSLPQDASPEGLRRVAVSGHGDGASLRCRSLTDGRHSESGHLVLRAPGARRLRQRGPLDGHVASVMATRGAPPGSQRRPAAVRPGSVQLCSGARWRQGLCAQICSQMAGSVGPEKRRQEREREAPCTGLCSPATGRGERGC